MKYKNHFMSWDIKAKRVYLDIDPHIKSKMYFWAHQKLAILWIHQELQPIRVYTGFNSFLYCVPSFGLWIMNVHWCRNRDGFYLSLSGYVNYLHNFSMDALIGNSTQCGIQDVHADLLPTLYFSQHVFVSMLSNYIYGGVVPYFIFVTNKFLSGLLLHSF